MKMKKLVNFLAPLSLLLGCVGEFVCCFVRGYEELWLSILLVSLEILSLAAIGLFKRNLLFSFFGTALGLFGSVLLIGFPSYVPFAAIVFFGLSLIRELILFFFKLKERFHKE